MMDEQLIDEVAHHSVIYNRQKYYMNGGGGTNGINKYETKDEAWQIIAMKLRSDVETCKKRWKYLRERYVSQRKQGDPPVYEHLSRPYLEKMKFLDQHIQPRKSYRSMPNYLTSPHSANSSYNGDYSMDTKSNGSIKSMNAGHYAAAANNHHYAHAPQQDAHVLDGNGNGQVKIEADQMFRDFAAAVASQQLHQHQVAAVAAAIADSSQNYQDHTLMAGSTTNLSAEQNGSGATTTNIKSPLSSPVTAGLNSNVVSATSTHNTAQSSPSSTSCANVATVGTVHGFGEVNTDDLDSSTGCNYNMKKPRVQLNNCHSSNNNNNNNTNANANTNNNNNHQNNNSSSSSNNNIHMNGINSNNFHATDTDEDSDDNSSSMMQPQTILTEHVTSHQTSSGTHSLNNTMQRAAANATNASNQFSSNAEFLFQLYQQLPHQQQQQLTSGAINHQQHQQQQQQQSHYKFQIPTTPNAHVERSSEQLLGELVTTELLKMTKERRKHVQKRILEILFFDD